MHTLERERAAALWALEKLDAIYRSEMDEPQPRPNWLQPFFEQNRVLSDTQGVAYQGDPENGSTDSQ